MRIHEWFTSFVLCGALASCTSPKVDDESLYLTGTEEGFILRNGQPDCNGKKVLLCHIPPGNPDNAHTICVSQNAVAAHQSHHGDPIGACATEPNPPPDEPPPPDDDGGGDGGGDGDPPTDPTPPPPPPGDGGGNPL